ncbi:hypothetical protein ZHAS_00016540 [Anopheles sinensis]|uniref:Uncharacterized protein n=1 Tax=Anopheles sinensis TaxID=74873 RepID=A0A084WDX1_ANOSI|nr:hypothetical protein ZHAS_00016540 [Anopheles sinensis]
MDSQLVSDRVGSRYTVAPLFYDYIHRYATDPVEGGQGQTGESETVAERKIRPSPAHRGDRGGHSEWLLGVPWPERLSCRFNISPRGSLNRARTKVARVRSWAVAVSWGREAHRQDTGHPGAWSCMHSGPAGGRSPRTPAPAAVH